MNKSIFTHKFSRIRSRMPLWAQLVVMLTFVTTVLLSFILVRDYQNNRRSIIERQISTSGRLLDLELQNLDQYVKELTSFCLQPLYDSDFSRIKSDAHLLFLAQRFKRLPDLPSRGWEHLRAQRTGAAFPKTV